MGAGGKNTTGRSLNVRVDPYDAALALGSPPDPRTNPQGYIDWYNSAQALSRDLTGLIYDDAQSAALQPFFKNLAIGEGLMQNASAYGYMQGADTTGAPALTNFLDNYAVNTGLNAYQPSQDWIINQALSGAPGYSFADRYIQYATKPDTGLDRPEGLYDLLPGQQYRVTDLKGNVIYTGTDAAKIANEYAPNMRDKGYSIQMSNPETGGWGETWTYVPDPDPLGQFAMMAGPMLGAALFPMLAPAIGLGGLGGSATAALGAGLGSAAGGAAAGQGIGNILKNAALSAGLTYAGGELLKGIGGGGTSATTGVDINADLIPNALSDLSFGPVGDILVTGSRIAAPIGSTLTGLVNPSGGQNTTSGDEILVTGTRPPATSGIGGGVGSNLFNPYQNYNAESYVPRNPAAEQAPADTEEIVITGPNGQQFTSDWLKNFALTAGVLGPAAAITSATGAGSGAGATANAGTGGTPAPTPDTITVTAPNGQTLSADWLKNFATTAAVFGPAAAVAANAGAGAGTGAGAGAGAAAEKGLGALTTADWIRIALAGGGTLANLAESLGGGGGGGSGTLTPTGGRYDVTPINRVQNLQTPAGVGLGDYGFDPFTYGQISGDQPGEYLFFSPAPTTSTTAMADGGEVGYAEGGEPSNDVIKHLIEYRKGGGHHGPGNVKGIGSGQDDKIPAWLSDGEYVWSAQDVSDLGDGSNDEGVRRLDKMRQLVRQRAGRKSVKKIAKPQKGIEHLLAAVGGK